MLDAETKTRSNATTEVRDYGQENRPIVLLTGATGYVGGRLISLLERSGVALKPTVVRDGSALEVFSIRPIGVEQAVCRVLKSEG